MTKTEERKIAEKAFAKKIEKYLKLKKNQDPDPKYCPTIYLLWNTRSGSKVKNVVTGKSIPYSHELLNFPNWKRYWYDNNKNKQNVFVSAPNVHRYCRYIKPDYNLGIIEISSITIDTKRTNGPTNFEFLGSRVFMSMDDKTLWAYQLPDSQSITIIKPTNYVERVPHCFYSQWYFTRLKLKTYITDGKSCHNNLLDTELFKFMQFKNIFSFFNGSREVKITQESFNVWTFIDWLTAKKATEKTLQKEKLIKDLLSAKLPATLLPDKIPQRTTEDGIFFQGIIKHNKYEEYDVFRLFSPLAMTCYISSKKTYETHLQGSRMNENTYYDLDTIRWQEQYRIFVNKNKIYILQNRDYYSNSSSFFYITAPNALSQVRGSNYWLADFDKIKNLKIFKYISYYIKEYPDNFVDYFIMTRQPITEQLCKIGCHNIASLIMDNNEVKANLKEVVGEVNAKGKNLKDVFGMTTKQLKYYDSKIDPTTLNSYWSTNLTLGDIGFVYELFSSRPCWTNKNDISNLDMKTFQDIVDLMVALKKTNCLHRSWSSRYRNDATLKFQPTFNSLIPNNIEPKNRYKYLSKMMKMCQRAGMNITVINDNSSMYNRLRGDFKPTDLKLEYNCPSDISRIHEALIELISAQQTEDARIRALQEEERNKELEKKMAKLDEKRKLLEYEDDTYLIRLPRKLSELSVEGTTQRICIGGYINSHARGASNIYFLRQKSDPDKPFFAIEEQGGRIIQIHGYCNRWLGSDDQAFAAVPFVMRWLHKNNIYCDTRILTCRSTGYGQTNSYRELPVVKYDD